MLKEQKILVGLGAVVVVGGLAAVFALSGGDDKQVAEAPTPRVATEQVQPAPAPVQAERRAPAAERPQTQEQRTMQVLSEFGGTMQDPCGHLQGNTKKECNRAVINIQDHPVLAGAGVTGNVEVLGYGRVCEADGTVSGNWKGSASSAAYTNGSVNICINHSGKVSKPVIGTGPVPR